MGKRKDLSITIRVDGINRQTGEIDDFSYDKVEGPDVIRKGNVIDMSQADWHGMIKFRIKNKIEPPLDMWFDTCNPEDCVWMRSGNQCPDGPTDPKSKMEIKVVSKDDGPQVIRVWNPNNKPGKVMYMLRLKCPDLPGKVAWIDPPVVNSGGGGGSPSPPSVEGYTGLIKLIGALFLSLITIFGLLRARSKR